MSEDRNTGPSLQTRRYPPDVTGTAHPMQTPSPQAMRSSIETKQEIDRSRASRLTAASMTEGPHA